MVRSFEERSLEPEVVRRVLSGALGAPSAGNARATAWLVLSRRTETWRYWEAATTEPWRARSRRWPGLFRAPVLVLSLCSPLAYVSRYAESDKAGSSADLGLGTSPASWAVPYWFGDAAFGVMSVLVSATAEGLGACFLGNFRREDDVLAAFGVPPGWRLFGTIALGWPDGLDTPSASLDRPAPSSRVHFGRWPRSTAAGD